MILQRSYIAVLAAGFFVFIVSCGVSEEIENGGATTAVTASQVSVVLLSNCMPCHSSEIATAELVLDTIEGLMAGSEHGPMVVPGDAAASHLIKSLRGDGVEQMPYNQDPLSEEDIRLIEDWIDAGAATS